MRVITSTTILAVVIQGALALNVGSPQRLAAAPVFGSDGPTCSDVIQPWYASDCWIDATLCSLAKINGWIKAYSAEKGNNLVRENAFTVFEAPKAGGNRYNSGPAKVVNVKYGDALKGDPQFAARWWALGFQIALKEVGVDYKADGGDPAMALAALTGMPSETLVINHEKPADKMAEPLYHCNESPVIIGTISGAKALQEHHAYTVMTYRKDGEKLFVTLRDPMGDAPKEHLWTDIYNSVDGIYHLKDYPSGPK